MISTILQKLGLDPSYIIGSISKDLGNNAHYGTGDYFVIEADEYDRSFLALHPTVAVVTNVEADHLDIYRDLDDINATFVQFMQPARATVLCGDDAGATQQRHQQAKLQRGGGVHGAAPSSACAAWVASPTVTRVSMPSQKFASTSTHVGTSSDQGASRIPARAGPRK